VVQVAAQFRQIDTAGGENPFAVGIVGERVEEMFERQVCMTARNRLAERDIQDDFKCG